MRRVVYLSKTKKTQDKPTAGNKKAAGQAHLRQYFTELTGKD
jgi:hypothetical protein